MDFDQLCSDNRCQLSVSTVAWNSQLCMRGCVCFQTVAKREKYVVNIQLQTMKFDRGDLFD